MKYKTNTNQSTLQVSKNNLPWSILSEDSQALISGGKRNGSLTEEGREGGIPDIVVRDDDDDS
ncbi:MAG: hypothetical protein AAFW75_17615 [Cyanobacteria bacterium J06636_16]